MPSPREISACYLYSGTPRRNVVEPVKQARSVQPLMSHMWWLSICPILCALENLSWGCLALSRKRQNQRVVSQPVTTRGKITEETGQFSRSQDLKNLALNFYMKVNPSYDQSTPALINLFVFWFIVTSLGVFYPANLFIGVFPQVKAVLCITKMK